MIRMLTIKHEHDINVNLYKIDVETIDTLITLNKYPLIKNCNTRIVRLIEFRLIFVDPINNQGITPSLDYARDTCRRWI